jgi:hypothetical protein
VRLDVASREFCEKLLSCTDNDDNLMVHTAFALDLLRHRLGLDMLYKSHEYHLFPIFYAPNFACFEYLLNAGAFCESLLDVAIPKANCLRYLCMTRRQTMEDRSLSLILRSCSCDGYFSHFEKFAASTLEIVQVFAEFGFKMDFSLNDLTPSLAAALLSCGSLKTFPIYAMRRIEGLQEDDYYREQPRKHIKHVSFSWNVGTHLYLGNRFSNCYESETRFVGECVLTSLLVLRRVVLFRRS